MIETVGLTKRYGNHTVVSDIDLSVPRGSVYGLVGPNGAGKTTLLALLSGLRRASSGDIAIDAPHNRIAVLPDTPRFDAWLSGREVVRLAHTLSAGDRDGDAAAHRVDEVLSQVGLAEAADRRVGGYSRGMLQRLGIAGTLVGDPVLVLLDEPASALDPQGRREVLDLIARLRGSATVLFSSHILGDVQEVCDTVGVLDRGRLLFQGPLASLLVGRAVPRYVVRLRSRLAPVVTALGSQDWVRSVEDVGGNTIAIDVDTLGDAEARLTSVLAASGARVVSFGPEEVSLERAFLELTR